MADGSSKPQLIVDQNLEQWVVKSANSTQGQSPNDNQMFNEMFAVTVAEKLRMPVMPGRVIEISDAFLDVYPDLRRPEFGGFTAGKHFASLFRKGISLREALASKREDALRDTINATDANAVICFDTWTFNHDRACWGPHGIIMNSSNLIFLPSGQKLFELRVIDFGLSFGGDWHDDTSKSPPLRLGNWHREVLGYMPIFFLFKWINDTVCSDWTVKINSLTYSDLEKIALSVPYDWRQHISLPLLQKFLLTLIGRSGNLDMDLKSAFSSGIINHLIALAP